VKTCAHCGEDKPLIMFHARSSAADGRQSWCKACANGYYRESPSYRKQRSASAKAYRERYPEKLAAHAAVQRALASGELSRGPCEVCGVEHGRIDPHHDSYDPKDWLNVRWLCRKHHRQHHALEDAKLRAKAKAKPAVPVAPALPTWAEARA
jgi:hypothetical protein